MKEDELTKIYIEILANFYLLNNTFNFKHPLEIYSLFLYCLNKGYFSNKKDFKRVACKLENYEHLPLTIMSGKGVCRNISTMLNNIFNIYKFDNVLTLLYSNPPEIDVKNISGDSRERLDKLNDINNYSYIKAKRNEMIRRLNEYGDNAYIEFSNLPENRNKFITYLGNHVVNTITYEDTTYVLDPTNFEILKQSDCNPMYLLNQDNLPYHITTPFQDRSEVTNLLERLKKINNNPLEYEEIIKETVTNIKSDEYKLESFYQNNKGLYKEITKGLKKQNKR